MDLRPIGLLFILPWTIAACVHAGAAHRADADSEPNPSQVNPPGCPVGFRSFWVRDPGRTYETTFDGGATYGATKSPRPVLVNMWYPATGNGTEMAHAGYLDIVPDDPALQPLATALAAYARSVLAKELTGAEGAAMSDPQRSALASAMDAGSGCVRDASPARGRYPLLIYHAGAGSSFEDNAGVCRDLAARGYVVIGSAFFLADGSSFNVDSANAAREFEFLIRLASGMEGVDWEHVGVIGHSAGAHGAMRFGATPGIAVDAIVLLDTTQDYMTVADPRWSFVSQVTANRKVYSTPTMFVANPHAIFDLADTLSECERVYLTVPVLDHNEFIAQGQTAARIRAELSTHDDGEAAARMADVARLAEELHRAIALYLDAKLKGDKSAWEELLAMRRSVLGDASHVEVMAVGATAGAPGDGPPTPRSVNQALAAGGARAAIAEMKRSPGAGPTVLNENVAFALQYGLVAAGRDEEAKQLFECFLGCGVDTRPRIVGDVSTFAPMKRHAAFVEGCLRLARVIGGNDPAVAEMIEKHGSSSGPR